MRGISGQCTSGSQVSEEGVERRLTTTLATGIAGRGLLAVNAGVILVTSSPAFAHHDTAGGGAATGGGAYFDALLPIVVAVVLVMAGLGFWGRKKRKTKPKRVKRRKRNF